MAGKKGRSGPPGNLNAAKSVLPALKRLRRGKQLAPEYQAVQDMVARDAADIVRDLGGEKNLTAMQRAMVDNWKVSHTAILLIVTELAEREVMTRRKDGSIDIQPALRSLSPFLQQERSALHALGMERRAQDAISLQEYVASKYGGQDA